LLDRVPDEFYGWVKKKAQFFRDEHARILNEAIEFTLDKKLQQLCRKDAALIIMSEKKNLSGILFKMLDRKNVESSIWDMLYPKHEIPFKTDEI